ncbi:MAG TPA: hypothetical protein VFV49_11260, partial [Thermoanaerobaculia bacterium]|nr:hypothetical protein [Thermoanaerobaculia bacterium]
KGYLVGNFGSPSPSAIDGVSHVRAYYDMGRNSSNCTKPLKDWYDNDPIAKTVPDCGFSFTGAGIPPGPGGSKGSNTVVSQVLRAAAQRPVVPVAIPGEVPPGKVGVLTPMAMTFECSNTNWP